MNRGIQNHRSLALGYGSLVVGMLSIVIITATYVGTGLDRWCEFIKTLFLDSPYLVLLFTGNLILSATECILLLHAMLTEFQVRTVITIGIVLIVVDIIPFFWQVYSTAILLGIHVMLLLSIWQALRRISPSDHPTIA